MRSGKSAGPDAGLKFAPAPSAVSERKWTRPERAADCDRVLREMCGEKMCATFDDARAALVNRRGPGCLTGEMGPCGAGKFVDYSSGFDGLSATFDEKGTLIALEARNDTIRECAIGAARACSPKSDDSFCPPRAIAEHCQGKCPTLDETTARLATEGGCPPGATIDKLECGSFTVVDERHGDASITRYFDAKGKLVAAQATNPAVSASMKWGETPKCSTTTNTPLCPPPAGKPAAKKKKK